LNKEVDTVFGEYVVIKALENGVNIIGLTRGKVLTLMEYFNN
jgi:hypothetical protein